MIEKYYHTLTSILLLILIAAMTFTFSHVRSNAFEEGRVVGHAEAAVESADRTLRAIDQCILLSKPQRPRLEMEIQ